MDMMFPVSARIGKACGPLLVIFLAVSLAGCGTVAPPEPEVASITDEATDSPADEPVPEFLRKPSAEHVRGMSFNVGWDSIFPDDDPMNDQWRRDSKTAEFVRIVQAIQPDIVCLQEISSARDPQQVGDILDAVLPLPDGEPWRTHSGTDNVIAARFDLGMRADRSVHAGSVTNLGHAMALIDLPDAVYEPDLYLLCAHFKSQGGQSNIDARQEHADGIVQWIADMKAAGGKVDLPAGTPFMLVGDFNVYDTDPAYHLTTLLTGDIVDEDSFGPDLAPDWDDTPLADALPRHNGVGPDTYTWRDDTQEFNPGVLDRIVYADSVIRVDNAFVLNTATMTEEELEATGLEAGDVLLDPQTGRYDHLPLAVDIIVIATEGE
jgi:endonuclease/exonuclease/phosphatase family metal-dependent hydrolase